MMPFFGGNTHHLARPQGSSGPSSSPGENFSAALDKQTRVDSMLSLEVELSTRYNENLRRVQELTGEDLSLPAFNELDYLGVAARRALGQDTSSFSTPEQLVPAFLAEFDKREERLAELREQYPDILTFDNMLDEVRQMRQEVMERSQDVGERGGVQGMIAGFAGAVVGSFNPIRDPLLVGSLFVGGWGSTIAKRLMTEAGIGAAVEGAQQFGFVQPTQDALGEEGTNPWLSIAAAGVGSGLFRGAIEVPGPAYRALEAQLSPQRAYARVLAEGLAGAPDFNALRRALDAAPNNPSTRAARYALDAEEALQANNPYGNSMVAQRQFMQELQQVQDMFDGRASTALPPTDTPTPRWIDETDFGQALVRAEYPLIARRLDDAQARLDAADVRITELTNQVEGRSVADSVELVDEASGLRVREIEAELQQPGARTQELEAELDMIVESLGPDAIARAENDWRIGPRRQLADARRSRQAAKREYNRANAEADRALEGIRRRDEGVRRVQEQLGVREADLFGRRLPDEAVTPDRVEALAQTVAEAEPRIDEVGEGLVVRNTAESPEVDVGLPENLPPDFQAPVIDAEGNIVMRPANEIMRDLNDDRAMLEAMRTCAI